MTSTLFELLEEAQSKAAVQGEWFSVQWCPDLATGERLNIGVGFVHENRVHTKLLERFERIKCLYDEQGVSQVRLIISFVEEAVQQSHTISPFSQVCYEQKGFAQGESVSEILNNLYSQTVPLGQKPRIRAKNKTFSSVSRQQLHTELLDNLRLLWDIDFDQFVPEDSYIRSGDGHDLFIPFRDGAERLAGLASAVSPNPQTVELNLLSAAVEVESAKGLKHVNKPALFILKPDDEQLSMLENDKADRIDGLLERFDWMMNKQGIQVGSHVTTSGLAEEIVQWAA